jgi:predicted transcriptional regulator YdeE
LTVRRSGDNRTQRSGKIEVKIVWRDAFQVVGTPLFGNPRANAFSKAWDLFGQIADETPWMRRKRKLFGLQIYPPKYPDPFEFTYLAGVQIAAGRRTPFRCVRKELPASRYAVFNVIGGPGGIDKTYQYACNEWLPQSHSVRAFPYDFEEYEISEDPDADPLRISIWIPIKRMKP